MSADLESIKDRIRKILAMAEDGRGNPNEAATAARMAAKLMEKYNLERADVLRQEAASGQGMGIEVVFLKRSDGKRVVRHIPDWVQWYAIHAARLNDCFIRIGFLKDDAGRQEAIKVHGFDGDRHCAAQTITTIFNMARAAALEFIRNGGTKAQGNDFLEGFALAVTDRLLRMNQEKARTQAEAHAEARAATPGATGTALVLADVKKDALVKKFGPEEYQKVGDIPVRDENAFHRGVVEGRKSQFTGKGVK